MCDRFLATHTPDAGDRRLEVWDFRADQSKPIPLHPVPLPEGVTRCSGCPCSASSSPPCAAA